MRRWGTKSGDFIWPIVISMKGAPNPEALMTNRDIHEGRSESGGFIGPKTSCTDGAPNPDSLFGQS
ncbi:hypothetical protein ACSBR1_015410 [Camellia fascicularis]